MTYFSASVLEEAVRVGLVGRVGAEGRSAVRTALFDPPIGRTSRRGSGQKAKLPRAIATRLQKFMGRREGSWPAELPTTSRDLPDACHRTKTLGWIYRCARGILFGFENPVKRGRQKKE